MSGNTEHYIEKLIKAKNDVEKNRFVSVMRAIFLVYMAVMSVSVAAALFFAIQKVIINDTVFMSAFLIVAVVETAVILRVANFGIQFVFISKYVIGNLAVTALTVLLAVCKAGIAFIVGSGILCVLVWAVLIYGRIVFKRAI